jgi:hypothetical protein
MVSQEGVRGFGEEYVLLPENPGLWCFLINWVSGNHFENRRLPDDVHLTVTGEPPNLQVRVSDGRAG